MALSFWSSGVWHYIFLWVGTGGSEENIVHFQGKRIEIELAGSSATSNRRSLGF